MTNVKKNRKKKKLKFPIRIRMEEGWDCVVNHNGSIQMKSKSGEKQTIVSSGYFEQDRAAIIKALEVSQNVRRMWAVDYAEHSKSTESIKEKKI